MASFITDNVRSLLSEHIFEVDSECVSEDLSCVLCNKLVVDAYQTHCGCKYCRDCIIEYLREGSKHCAGRKPECSEALLVLDGNVNKSSMLDKKVTRLKVRCPNRSCQCIVEIMEMVAHLIVCTKQVVECPYSMVGCDIEGSTKDRVEIHLHKETYIHSEMLMQVINNLHNELGGLKENLQLSHLEVSALRKESVDNEIFRKEMNQRMEDRMREVERLKEKAMKKEVQVSDLQREMTTLRLWVEAVLGSLGLGLNNSGFWVNDDIRAMQMEMDMKVKREGVGDTVARSIKENLERVNTLSKRVESIYIGTNKLVAVGVLSFTVERFSKMKAAGEEIISPYFYSHANGYKLQLEVYPGGRSGGKGTHLSVFLVICKGEYDEVLPWPYRHTVTISIINQHSLEASHSVALDHSKGKHVYHKPTNKDNDGCGWPKFVSHDYLKSTNGLILGDSVVLRCVVGHPL